MLPISTKDVVRHCPSEDGPTYLLAVPSYLQRAAFRRDLRAAGATYPGDRELYQALRDDLRTAAPHNLDDLLAVVDAAEDSSGAGAGAGGTLADPSALMRVEDVARVVRALGGRFAGVEGDRAYFFALAPYIACRHFLVGWEGRDEPFVRAHGTTGEETLAHLGEEGIAVVGSKILDLMVVGRDAVGNSRSPSRSHSNPPPSTLESKRLPPAPADGTSAAPSTATTPPAA